MQEKRLRILAAMATLLIASLVLAACGSDGDHGSGGDDSSASKTDGAFVAGMVPHHESAIEMAKLAEQQGQHPEIKQLAADITKTQQIEIQQLSAAHQRLFDESVSEGADKHGSLGLDEHASGMGSDASALDGAKPFDREFIDMMIPHHQGAIRMARVELAEGEDTELMEIARMIIDAQTLEIQEMNSWRQSWYGAPSPAGGVPAEEESDGGSSKDGSGTETSGEDHSMNG